MEKTDITGISLTPEARDVIDILVKADNKNNDEKVFKDMAQVRDLAVAHAIKKEIKFEEITASPLIWGSQQITGELIEVLRIIYPEACEEEGVYRVFQSLCNLGLLDLAKDPNFEYWNSLSDLPGFETLREN